MCCRVYFYLQKANRDLAIRLEIIEWYKLDLGVASSRYVEGLRFFVKYGNETKVFENIRVAPALPWQNKNLMLKAEDVNIILCIITDAKGKELLAYQKKRNL